MSNQENISIPAPASVPAADDAVLVAAARRDARAFGALYEKYVTRIYRYAFVRLRNEPAAQDATGQTFLKALQALPQFHDGTFSAWLFRIAHNVVADLIRRAPVTSDIDALESELHTNDSPAEHALQASERDAFYRALNELPEEQRAVLELTLGSLKGEEVDDPNAPPTRETRGETKTWYAGPTRWRIEAQYETTNQPPYKQISIADGAAHWAYNPIDNTVNIQVADAHSFPSPRVLSLDFLSQDMSNCYEPKVVGEDTIAGRAAYNVDLGIAKCRSASAPQLNGPHTLWLDKETFFVLKSEIRRLDGDHMTSSMQVTSIRYNLDLLNDLFTFTPPAAARVNDMHPKPASNAQEFQAQLSALARKVDYPIFAPTSLPDGLVPRAPVWNETENQIELAYVPADEAGTKHSLTGTASALSKNALTMKPYAIGLTARIRAGRADARAANTKSNRILSRGRHACAHCWK